MTIGNQLLISADSHVIEPHDLWATRLPSRLSARAPVYPPRKDSPFSKREGGWNPEARVKEMAVDGVSGEVLYPSLAMDQFGIPDAELQEACLTVYNDWLIEYCAHQPDRLFGVGAICTYNIDHAIREAKRCKDAGLCGLLVWQVPPKELSFTTDHYDRLWAVVQEMELPVSLHILTGEPYGPGAISGPRIGSAPFDLGVNRKLYHAASCLTDLMTSGVLERFPRLKFVLVENEVSWLPFLITQWDKYSKRMAETPMTVPPSEYFRRQQIYSTFFNDPPSHWLFREWGADNCLWSNDFPHGNSTWPDSRKVIARDLGELPEATVAKLLHGNVTKLYNLPPLAPLN